MSVLVAAVLIAAPVVQETEPLGRTVRITLAADAIGLADTVPLTLEVEGLAPLRVSAADQLSASPRWRVVATRAGQLEALEGDRVRWRREYRVAAFQPPSALAVPLELKPIQLNRPGPNPETEPTVLPVLMVRVTAAAAVAGEPRPLTDLEPAEALPVTTMPNFGPVLLAVAGLLAAVLTTWIVGRRRSPSPETWAAHELAGLDAADADGVARVLRGYVEKALGVPAARRTTVELQADERVPTAILELLMECDRVRFANSGAESGLNLRAEATRAIGKFRENG